MRRMHLRDVPDDVYSTLADAARANRQSLSAFVVERLSEAAQVERLGDYLTSYESPLGSGVSLEDAVDAVRGARGARITTHLAAGDALFAPAHLDVEIVSALRGLSRTSATVHAAVPAALEHLRRFSAARVATAPVTGLIETGQHQLYTPASSGFEQPIDHCRQTPAGTLQLCSSFVGVQVQAKTPPAGTSRQVAAAGKGKSRPVRGRFASR